MVVSRGLADFSCGREHLAVMSRTVVTRQNPCLDSEPEEYLVSERERIVFEQEQRPVVQHVQCSIAGPDRAMSSV